MPCRTSATAALLLWCGIAGAGDDARRESKLLEGTWKITAAEVGGRKVESAKLGVDQIAFAGDRVILKNGGKDVATHAFTLDPARKPKQMNWREEKGRTAVPLIYELDGDTLKLCRPLP